MSSNKSSTVLITGSSRGIGLGLVNEYLRQGFQVIATCRTPEIAMALADVLKKYHQRPPIKLDVGSLNSIQDCQKEIMNNYESIDVLGEISPKNSSNHVYFFLLLLANFFLSFRLPYPNSPKFVKK